MALFRKFFYRKPPDGLLEISERVFVFDCCFSTDGSTDDKYKVYIGDIVSQLQSHFPDASFMVFNFREGSGESLISTILSQHDMTVMEYPMQYEGCPLLTIEMIHHYLRSGESWLSLGQQNLVLMHCERGGWSILAFMLAALLVYRKQYTNELKTLEMIYKQAPRELLQLLSLVNPIPSQLRYLQYISRRNVGSEWPPLDRALTLDCVILRNVPDFNDEGGCRPVFRIYGQDPLLASEGAPKVLFSTPKKSRAVRFYKQDCQLVKIDIHCHIQGDVVLECICLDVDHKREEMIFRVMFNTTFIRSNILMLNRDEIDLLWNAKERFPKDFRAEVLLSEMDSSCEIVSPQLSSAGDKDGLPVEVFAKVQEIFNSVDWLDTKNDAALHILHRMTSSDLSDILSKEEASSSGKHTPQEKFNQLLEDCKIAGEQSNLKQPEDDSKKREFSFVKQPVPLLDQSLEHMQHSDSDQENERTSSVSCPPETEIVAQRLSVSRSLPSLSCNSLSGLIASCSRNHSSSPAVGIRALLEDHADPRNHKSPTNTGASAVAAEVSSETSSLSSLTQEPVSSSQVGKIPEPMGSVTPRAAGSKGISLPPQSPMQKPAKLNLAGQASKPLTSSSSTTYLSADRAPPSTISAKSRPVAPVPPPLPPPPPSPQSLLISQPVPSRSTPVPHLQEHSGHAEFLHTSLQSTVPVDLVEEKQSLRTTSKKSAVVPPPPPPPPRPSFILSDRVNCSTKCLSNVVPTPTPLTSSQDSKLQALSKEAISAVILAPQSKASASNAPPPPPPPPPSQATVAPPPPPPPTMNSSSVPIAPPPPPYLSSKQSSTTNAPPPPVPPPRASDIANAPGVGNRGGDVVPPPPPNGTNGPLLGDKGRGTSRFSGLSSKLAQASKKSNLKPLHWVKVTRAMQGSLWAEAQKSGEALKDPVFDMSELENLFSAAVPKSSSRGLAEKPGARPAGTKSEKIHLIDLRRANNCGIMLTKVKMPLSDLMSAILRLDDSVLDADQVDNLIKFTPSKEDIELLKGYNGDKESLGECEQYFMELMKIPRVESKLRVFSFRIQFRSQVADLRRNLNTVNCAADEIKNSVKLKRIMQTILSLGNALNQGTARGSAVGFRLDSLLKLSDTRARNNKMTLMHYLCKVLAEKLPELLDFSKDLGSLEQATKIQLKALAEEMQAVTKGLEKVVQELTESESDGPVSETFRKTSQEFLKGAEADVRALTSIYATVGRNADALALYFGEDPARCPFEQVVSTLLNFMKMFERAHEENSKQQELEKKKAQKELEHEKAKVNNEAKDLETFVRSPRRSASASAR